MKLSNKTYDTAKWFAQIGLPAVGSLYFALAQIWTIPYSTEIVGTITAVDAFLGVILGISSRTYNSGDSKYDGVMNIVEQASGKKTFTLELNDNPDDLESKDVIAFKVNPSSFS